MRPAIPDNELQRLAALRSLHILHTPQEERFDRITRLASSIFHVPIALISLVGDDYQWFKSCLGLSVSGTARDISFCGHAILDNKLFIVPDARCDPRFADNPLVTGDPWVRFYAGYPLRTLSGATIGTLCIIDREPRQLSQNEHAMLSDLGAWAENEINTTEISQAFIAQRENAARLRAIMESTSDAMVLVTPEHQFLTVNQKFCEFFSIPRARLEGQYIQRIKPMLKRIFVDSDQIVRLTVDILADTKQHFTIFVQQKWPVTRELEFFSAPVFDTHMAHIGRLFVFRDVTREREIEQMKNEFVSQVSHELRSPLTAIKGYIDLFADGNTGPLTELQQHLVTIMQDSTDHLMALINDLLDVARMESGYLELHRSQIAIQPIIENVMNLLRPKFQAKQQVLTYRNKNSLPLTLADACRLQQVFTNLLANANQYTPEGGTITITTSASEQYLSIEVQDTGLGLSREEQAHIFDKFYRAKNGQTEFTVGAGLGLTISRSIVEAHKGKIEVSSAAGQGSTFTISLPTIAELRRTMTNGASPTTYEIPVSNAHHL